VEAWNLAGCSLRQMPLPQIWQLDPLLKQSNVSKAIFKSNKKNPKIPKFSILMAGINHQPIWMVYDIALLTYR